MAESSEKIVEIKGNESHEELVAVCRENFDALQRVIESLVARIEALESP